MRAVALGACCLLAGCTSGDPAMVIEIRPDAPLGQEAITCFGVDASSFAGRTLCGMEVDIAEDAAVPLHHAIVYADRSRDYLGAAPCDLPPPGSVSLGGWLPGSGATLLLPDGVGMLIPDATQSFVVQAHALRVGQGAPAHATIRMRFCEDAPLHAAVSTSIVAEVPTIAPHARATASAACTAHETMNVVRLWPHMHRAGVAFTAWTSDEATPVLRVDPWDFEHQLGHRADLVLAPGDTLHVRCDWDNASDTAIDPGPLTRNEMCTMGVLVWPSRAAGWESCR